MPGDTGTCFSSTPQLSTPLVKRHLHVFFNIVQATSTPTATVTQVMDAPTSPCQSENLAPATVSVPPNSLPNYSSDLMNLQGINDGVDVSGDLNS